MDKLQVKKRMTSIVKIVFFVLFSGILAISLPSCNKSKENNKAQLSVRMTDAPADYKAVMIDVQGVEIIGTSGTVLLNTTIAMVNLLDLSNGVNTLIATGDIEAGTISQIRLILGSNSSVTVGSVVYPLSTPSAMQSGLKIQVNQTFEPGVAYSILLDFDASQSIVVQGNGQYQLKPVIRTIDTAISGSIQGSITPIGAIAVVTATNNGLIYTSVTSLSGKFLIAGLPMGTYDITVTPLLPLLPVTVTGKIVVVGVSTNVGVIAL